MPRLNPEENVPLAPLTTLGVGGPARYLARCPTPASLSVAFDHARELGLATFVLGGGSNLLVSDDGFDGLVVRIDDGSLSFEDESGLVTVRAGAGVDWDVLVAATVDAGLGGLECLSGIPGLVGAAPIQNLGAYGQEVSETIAAVHALERATGDFVSFAPEDCGFGYRRSHFKGAWAGRYAVVRVDFRLPRRSFGAVRYADLERRFGAGAAPPLAKVRQAVLEVRRSKSMVLESDDPNRRSAGSFFTNPIVTPATADDVRRRLAADDMPVYPAADGRVKLSAAWLIERSGLRRGERLGRAGISTRHSLALVNLGGATAAEIVALARRVRSQVRERTGVVLEPEPVFLGFAGGVDGALS
ncbi:MAG TPA: UDP-N-acetylmuramate dehydrogenase [Thermoanaerobaculia bacterium]|jgi:UDP-N-acetylmuramate dehydrogenase